MEPTGIARTEIELKDLSAIIRAGIKGIHGVVAVTEMGPLNKPTLITNWADYTRIFGGLLTDNDDPLIIKRALEAKAVLKISRVANYSDIDDLGTVSGSVASGDLGSSTNIISFESVNIGDWGNKITVSVEASPTDATKYDYTITFAGRSELTQIIRNQKLVMDAAEIAKFNAEAKYVKIVTITGTPTVGTVTLTNGAQIRSSIVAADYIGSKLVSNGIYAFGEDNQITKLSVPGKADPVIDIALANYADEREDIMVVLRTPVGVTAQGAIDYREGTGGSSHTAVNTWRAVMTTGGLKVTHPVSGAEVNMPETGDVLGAMSRRDNQEKEWFSFAGPKRGIIRNALGVVYNLGTSARSSEANLVDMHGLNPVIDHSTYGPVIWGNSTLQKADTMLKHANVAELVMFIIRGLKPITDAMLFDPNDIETWKAIYRGVTPFMDAIVTGRGLWDYVYQGDQNIDDISQAVINTTDGIDAGKYEFELHIKPIGALKYIGIRVSLHKSGADFTVFE